MKKLILALCMVSALTLVARAEDAPAKKDAAPKHTLTAEQTTTRNELIAKYDTDKNGKLNKDEKAKMTPEDLAKWQAIYPAKKKGDAAPKADAPADKKQ